MSITDSIASELLNEVRQEFKDVHCKRLILDVFEANSLQRVTVKLEIDFDQFLELQRKLPEEYVNKRVAIAIPLMHFDDYMIE